MQGSAQTGSHLMRGVEVYQLPDGQSLVLSPSGRRYRVTMAAAEAAALLGLGEDGTHPRTVRALPQEISECLSRDGCLRPAGGDVQSGHGLRMRAGPQAVEHSSSVALVVVGDGGMVDVAMRAGIFDRFGATRVVGEVSDLGSTDLDGDVILLMRDRFDYEALTSLNDRCQAEGRRWTQFHLARGRGFLGPSVRPGATSDYRDLLGRRLCALEDTAEVAIFRALLRGPVAGDAPQPTAAELAWMLGVVVTDIERWMLGAETLAEWHEVELDPVRLVWSRHPVLPLPDHRLAEPPADVLCGEGWVVDDRTGLVSSAERVRLHPTIPDALIVVQSTAADMSRLYLCPNSRLNHGSSFTSESDARAAAVGECLERYCGNFIDPNLLTYASYDELRARGDHAVDPTRLVLFSKRQYALPGFPFVPFTRQLRVNWVRGRSLTRGIPAWVPASLVYVNWFVGPYAGDPPTNDTCFAGNAAGPSLEFALAAAIEEVVERDATMVWWLNGLPLPAVRLTPQLADIWKGRPAELGQRSWLIHLDNEFRIPVLAGVVENTGDQILTVGFAARPHPVDAALKAWAEALALHETARGLHHPRGSFWRLVGGLFADQHLKPRRDDRRYLDTYRSDFHDVVNLYCQMQINLDPRARDFHRHLLDVDTGRAIEDLPSVPTRTVAAYRERVEGRGFEIFYVDQTTPDVALSGAHVVRVVIPGLVPNFPAAFPPLGTGRVQSVPVALGWRDEALGDHELNYFPMPHA